MPQYSVCICHTIFVSFWIIFHVPACCLYGHRSRRRMSIGVLGSPEKNFVDIGQARTKIALANA